MSKIVAIRTVKKICSHAIALHSSYKLKSVKSRGICRRQQLEAVILKFFNEDSTEEKDAKDEKAKGLPEGLLEQALLIGLGPKRRRRIAKRKAKQKAIGSP